MLSGLLGARFPEPLAGPGFAPSVSTPLRVSPGDRPPRAGAPRAQVPALYTPSPSTPLRPLRPFGRPQGAGRQGRAPPGAGRRGRIPTGSGNPGEHESSLDPRLPSGMPPSGGEARRSAIRGGDKNGGAPFSARANNGRLPVDL